MRSNKYLQLAIAGALALVTGTASAVITLDLTGPILGKVVGPQSSSNPCIIAGTTCQQPDGMGYNLYSPNSDSAYNRYSTNAGAVNVAQNTPGTNYTVGQLTGLVGDTFVVAIDVNTTGAKSEILNLFEVIINNVVVYNYVGPTAIGVINNNGNGYADWTLGLIDLSSFADGATVLFHAVWSGAVDGTEQFFLVSSDGTTPPIGLPEPATLALVGLALVGMGAARRGRKA